MHSFSDFSFHKQIAAALVVASILSTSGFAATKSVPVQHSRRANGPAAKAIVPAPREGVNCT